ncbi:amino acid transporter AVT1H-like [Papaver somniferum]|uniref:amino acid transporter AVT1H-like n=1 Tax=Papaver somniferum TaxID=3469 RepID=UPI000E701F4F|nr:amino acid transporter AVT1H-like [Papaver somniferum]
MNISDVCSEEYNNNRDLHVHDEKKLTVLIDNGDGAARKEDVKTNSSFLHSVINMSAILIGLGQLSTPYALQKGGWVSSFLLIGFGILCAYTSHLLGRCLKKDQKIRNYSDIGNHAFGAKGKVIASTFIYLEVFMALVSFTIALNDNLATVFDEKHLNISWTHLSTSQFLTVTAVIVALPTVWLKDLSKISFLSVVGIILSFLIFYSVIHIAAFGGVKANRFIPVLRLHNIPAISGLYVFSFSTHVVFPDIYRSMKDPSKFTKVSIVSFTIVTTFYTTIAFVGAKLFGPEVNSQVTLNMPKHLLVTKMALWATVLAPLTKYAFALVPIASQYDRKLPSSVSSNTRWFIRGTIGSMLLILVLILALAVPYFEQVLGLTGSLVSISVSIIFPCAFYTKIYWSQISKPFLALNVSLIVIASVLGVLGTISSSKSLVNIVIKKSLSVSY